MSKFKRLIEEEIEKFYEIGDWSYVIHNIKESYKEINRLNNNHEKLVETLKSVKLFFQQMNYRLEEQLYDKDSFEDGQGILVNPTDLLEKINHCLKEIGEA